MLPLSLSFVSIIFLPMTFQFLPQEILSMSLNESPPHWGTFSKVTRKKKYLVLFNNLRAMFRNEFPVLLVFQDILCHIKLVDL